jgi:two-component system, chemotaxis family, sensor kinase CheA
MASKQLRKVFVMESEDRLQQMEESLLHLEQNPADSEAINVLFRAAHTIKGSAGVVGFDAVSRFMHVVENTLDKVRNNELQITPPFVKLLLTCHDFIGEWLAYSAEHEEPDVGLEETRNTLLKQLDAVAHGQTLAVELEATPPQSLPEPPPKALDKNAQRREAFRAESGKILHALEESIRVLGQDPSEHAPLDDIFHSVLSLKNAASAVKFAAILDLAQNLETLLIQRRNKDLPVNESFLNYLRSGHTLFSRLRQYAIEHSDAAYSGDLAAELSDALHETLAQLQNYPPTVAEETSPANSAPMVAHATPIGASDHEVAADNWHISLRFKPEALMHGVEPMDTLHYLSGYGRIVHLSALFDSMPEAEKMDAEACYMGFELGFMTDLDKNSIENLFELIYEDCDIHILSPHSYLSHYIDLIKELPEDTLRLGEILTQVGTLTQRELEQGLSIQAQVSQRKSGGEAPRLGEILVDSGMVRQDVIDAAVDKQRKTKQYRPLIQRGLHVDATKLDQLIDLVGELVITHASMKLLIQDARDERMKKVGAAMARLVEEIRNRTLSMRMIPIGDTFNRFRRVVHDLSASLDKKIELELNGADAELDKSMVEKISDPLIHLVRNAIDHGIEPIEERLAQGKPAEGRVQLNAYHDSGSIVIEVSDDGRGLNPEKILAAAINKGLAKPGQELSEAEILNFIFEPGLSTAREVTQVSGRGVGLDVVKRNLSALNGIINIETSPGEGTTMQIYLPLTLAIIDGFLLSAGHSAFVVPLDRVIRCIKYTDAFREEAKAGYINLRGKVLPLLHVHELFGLAPDPTVKNQNIVVVRYGNNEAGLVVDNLQGEFQAVIKPLGKIFEHMPGISGATILGTGEVALILDVPALVQRYGGAVKGGAAGLRATINTHARGEVRT